MDRIEHNTLRRKGYTEREIFEKSDKPTLPEWCLVDSGFSSGSGFGFGFNFGSSSSFSFGFGSGSGSGYGSGENSEYRILFGVEE